MNLESLKTVLKELCSKVALAGYEDPIIRYVVDYAKDKNYEPAVDNLGNVIVQLNQKEGAKKLLIFAHMDELGLVVTKIEKDGFLRVERLGGIPEKSLAGTEIIIETSVGQYSGIVGTKSHHITPQYEKHIVKTVDEVYVDLGFTSKQQVLEAGIQIGTPVGYARRFFTNNSRVFSNTLDNRAGCLTLLNFIETIDLKKLDVEVYVVFSVQEEFNLRGVLPAVRKIYPDFGITVDITIAADTPDLKGKNEVQLGGGPCIGLYTFHGRGTLGGVIPNPKYVSFIEEVAQKENIRLQRFATMGMLTDASFAQVENNGFPIVDLSFPARYSHAPLELIDLHDVEELTLLLKKIAESLNSNTNFSRG